MCIKHDRPVGILEWLYITPESVQINVNNRTGAVAPAISSHLYSLRQALISTIILLIIGLTGLADIIIGSFYFSKCSDPTLVPLAPMFYILDGVVIILLVILMATLILLKTTICYKRNTRIFQIANYLTIVWVVVLFILSFLELSFVSVYYFTSRIGVCMGNLYWIAYALTLIPIIFLSIYPIKRLITQLWKGHKQRKAKVQIARQNRIIPATFTQSGTGYIPYPGNIQYIPYGYVLPPMNSIHPMILPPIQSQFELTNNEENVV
ncbi:hypothetical protein I4U23_003919 [Adineta vaga]|nr:hypothetical protein I4U23_003919 [Adineta vaga]